MRRVGASEVHFSQRTRPREELVSREARRSDVIGYKAVFVAWTDGARRAAQAAGPKIGGACNGAGVGGGHRAALATLEERPPARQLLVAVGRGLRGEPAPTTPLHERAVERRRRNEGRIEAKHPSVRRGRRNGCRVRRGGGYQDGGRELVGGNETVLRRGCKVGGEEHKCKPSVLCTYALGLWECLCKYVTIMPVNVVMYARARTVGFSWHICCHSQC